MPRRNQTRRQIVARAQQVNPHPRVAHPRLGTGGTSAPRSAGGGPRTGIGAAKPAIRGGPGGRTAPGAPGPGGGGSATPYSPAPWDSRYESIVAGAQRNYDLSGGEFDQAEAAAKQEYGLDAGYNDYAANPYSRAALLQENYLASNRAVTSGGGRGLYAGSSTNALESNRADYGEARNRLENSYREALGEISTRRREAREARETEEREAERERNERAEESDLEPDTAPAGGGGGGGRGRGKGRGRGGGGGGGGGGGKARVGRARVAR